MTYASYTSQNRPAFPKVGMSIVETDTGKELFYYGTTLGWLPAWNLPWGEIGAFTTTGTFNTASTSYVDITGMVVNFSAINGRRYAAKLLMEAQISVANNPMDIALTDISNNLLNEARLNPSSTTAPMEFHVTWAATAALIGTQAVKGRMKQVTSGQANMITPGTQTLQVWDVGPIAAPVITS